MFERLRTRTLGAAAVLAVIPILSGALLVSAKPPVIKDKDVVEVQVLALNDFHGNVEPPAGSGGRVGTVNAGGAAYLATHIKTLEATNANSIVVSAGDLIGASPILSALFHDEPTIEAMNSIGLDINAVGNHEFDEGATELLRMQDGGCHPVDGCQDGDAVRRRGLRLPGGQRRQDGHDETLFAAVLHQELQRRQGRLHRHDARGHAAHRDAGRHPGLEFKDEVETDQRARARDPGTGCRGDRHPDPRGRLAHGAEHQRRAPASPAPS